MTIAVSGLWHLGCVLCACWAQKGHRVLGLDPDRERIEDLRQGRPPLYEPGLSEALQHPQLSFSSEPQGLADCQVVFIAIDTPVDEQDRSLTACLEEQIDWLAPHLQEGALLVVSSQSPVGFCRQLRERLRRHNPSLELVYSPENLRLGDALRCYLEPGHIVIGCADEQAQKAARELFAAFPAELHCMNLESAEMAKHGINTFLAMSIVYTNALADLCEDSGADITQVVGVMKKDPRIGLRAYLEPGVGFSGGTLGRDLQVLAGRGGQFFEQLWSRNQERKDYVLRRLERECGALSGLSVGVLGLTYKPGTSTLRRSLPLAIVLELQRAGAQVQVFDPKADFEELPPGVRLRRLQSVAEVAQGVQVLLLLTAWPEFLDYPWESLKGTASTVLDTKNCLKPERVTQAGMRYLGVGR